MLRNVSKHENCVRFPPQPKFTYQDPLVFVLDYLSAYNSAWTLGV